MRTPQRCLALAAAALLLLNIASARSIDIKGPRVSSDRAPLEVDRCANRFIAIQLLLLGKTSRNHQTLHKY
jgi:hypothetical protein